MSSTAVRASNKQMNMKRESMIAAALFLSPALIMLAIWFVYPLLQAFIISFQDFNYINRDQAAFVGLQNYVDLFKDRYFFIALTHSLTFVVIVVPVQTFLALVLATLVNQNLKGRGFFRTAYYTPYVLSAVAVATVFMYFFVKDAALPRLLSLLGLPNETWFANVSLAMPFIGIMYIWQMVGFYMIYYLSGLQTVPSQIYEAAQIDGAGKLQTFFYVTIPNLKHTTFLVVLYGTIQAFQLYDQIAVVTSGKGGLGSPAGATSTMLTYFYTYSFQYYKMGYGSAVAVVLFLIIMAVSVVQRRLTKLEDANESIK